MYGHRFSGKKAKGTSHFGLDGGKEKMIPKLGAEKAKVIQLYFKELYAPSPQNVNTFKAQYDPHQKKDLPEFKYSEQYLPCSTLKDNINSSKGA